MNRVLFTSFRMVKTTRILRGVNGLTATRKITKPCLEVPIRPISFYRLVTRILRSVNPKSVLQRLNDRTSNEYDPQSLPQIHERVFEVQECPRCSSKSQSAVDVPVWSEMTALPCGRECLSMMLSGSAGQSMRSGKPSGICP